MPMNFSPETPEPQIKTRQSEDMRMAYITEFRKLLRSHPTALEDFHKIEDEVSRTAAEAFANGDSVPMYNGHYEEGAVTVDLLDAIGSTEAKE